jgi:hypothetical protein
MRICSRDQLLAILLLLWILLLLGNFYFRGVSRFEGNLITQVMSFTYVDYKDKRFLNSIDDISKLNLKGKQPASLILNGKFSSPNSKLNSKLQSLKKLEIQLTNTDSRLILEAANDKAKQTNAITLKDLRILRNTQVKQLTYLPKANQLKFCLQTSLVELRGCEAGSLVESNSIGTLEFEVNPGKKINFYLTSAQIPALGITKATLETQLSWLPAGQDFVLPISSPTSIQIDLPKAGKPSAENVMDEVNSFIRGDILVKNVHFSKLDQTGDINDNIETSAIRAGEVRMMGQSLKLKPDQFLITNSGFENTNCHMSPGENPGIKRLKEIRINANAPQGMQTLFSGESKCLAIGLDQDLPTQSIEPSWLLKYLPQEGVNAIYTLIGAFTGILFPRLFPDKKDPKG